MSSPLLRQLSANITIRTSQASLVVIAPSRPHTLPNRNEQHQEQLWEISVKILKDRLSPPVLEQYGPTLHSEERKEN